MKNLGIRIETSQRENQDNISPAFPHLAFAYYRSGFVRLAGKIGNKEARVKNTGAKS